MRGDLTVIVYGFSKQKTKKGRTNIFGAKINYSI